MLTNSLSIRIAEYRAAAAAVPVTAPDDIMDAATGAEFVAFDLVCRIPAGDMVGVAAKLALASELLGVTPTWGQRLAEKAIEEMRVIQWNAEWRLEA